MTDLSGWTLRGRVRLWLRLRNATERRLRRAYNRLADHDHRQARRDGL